MATLLNHGETILFIGDSITDCNRREPQYAPYGRGYVNFFRELQIIREPEKSINIINRGIGGNTVEDLRSRWTDDCLSHKPDWLSIKIGINDANRSLCSENQSFLPPKVFKEILHDLLTQTAEALPDTKLLLISPFFLSTDKSPDSYRTKVLDYLPPYISALAELSEEFGARFIDMQQAWMEQLRHRHVDVYCPEPVHPHPIGHLFMAEKVYAALSQ